MPKGYWLTLLITFASSFGGYRSPKYSTMPAPTPGRSSGMAMAIGALSAPLFIQEIQYIILGGAVLLKTIPIPRRQSGTKEAVS